jgi:hypothetical protein
LTPIYVRITVDNVRSEISIKQKVLSENWNSAKGMTEGKTKELMALNRFLEGIRSQHPLPDLRISTVKSFSNSLYISLVIISGIWFRCFAWKC